MASLMPPPARPLRLDVHVLPAKAINDQQIKPMRQFVQVTPPLKTLQEFCSDISNNHSRLYGGPLKIMKCQTASCSDVDLEYKISDVFDDHDVIRIIQAPGRYKRPRSHSNTSSSGNGRTDSEVPNRRPTKIRRRSEGQRPHDHDKPVRSAECDDDETTSLCGPPSPMLQFSDSQRTDANTPDQGQTNGIRDVSHSHDYACTLSPDTPYPRLRSFQEIESSQIDGQLQLTPQGPHNRFSPSDLESPFELLGNGVLNLSPGPGMVRSGSETSSHPGDGASQRNVAGRRRRSGSERHTLPIKNAAGKGRSSSAAMRKQRDAEKLLQAADQKKMRRDDTAEVRPKESSKAGQVAHEGVDEAGQAVRLVEEESRVSDIFEPKTSGNLPGHSGNPNGTPIAQSDCPPCESSGQWNPGLDEILFAARSTGQDWSAIRHQHFPDFSKTQIRRRYTKLAKCRESSMKNSGGRNATLSFSDTEPLAAPAPLATPASRKTHHESSTALIPSNGKVIKNVPAQMCSPVPVIRRVSFAEINSPSSGQKEPADRSAVDTKSNSRKETHVPAPQSSQLLRKEMLVRALESREVKPNEEKPNLDFKPKRTPIPVPPPRFASSPASSSFEQPMLVPQRLGISDVKSTAKVSRVSGARKLTVKPAQKTPAKATSLERQNKVVLDSYVYPKGSSQPITSSHTGMLMKSERNGNQSEAASADRSSGEEQGSDKDADSSSLSSLQKTKRHATIGQSSETPTHNDARKCSGRRSLSRERSATRDSRSPVVFISRRPTVSVPKSIDRGDSLSPGSSPPLLKDNNRFRVDDLNSTSEEDDADDLSSDSEENNAADMDLDELPVRDQLPYKDTSNERSMDKVQPEIRRESSQGVSSSNLPAPSNRPPPWTQLPSLIEMSLAPNSDKESNSDAVKSDRVEHETESDDDSECSDTSSSSSDDDNVGSKSTARRAAGDKSGKRKPISFAAIRKRLSRKK